MAVAIVFCLVIAVIGVVFWFGYKTPESVAKKPQIPELPPEPQPSTNAPIRVEPLISKVEAPSTGDTRRYIRLIKGGSKQPNGLENLRVELRQGETLLDSVVVISGMPLTQYFRYASQSKPGSLEPIPEGYYSLGMPQWKGTSGDYSKSWGAGLGPMWLDVTPAQPMARGDFGFHFDENMKEDPGSTGAPAFQHLPYFKTFISWFDNPKTAPKLLVVNWGLGSVETKGMGYKSYGGSFDSHELTPWEQLLSAVKKRKIEFPELKSIALAQWILESNRGTTKLASDYFNFGGVKYREELVSKVPGATKVWYTAHDGPDWYFHLKSPEQYVDLYWAFIERAPYKGWREAAAKGPEAYIRFIAQCGYMGGPGAPQAKKDEYADKILNIWPEAKRLLGEVKADKPKPLPEPELPKPAGFTPEMFVEQYRAEFKARGTDAKTGPTFYKLGARGPDHYDCSTSIAYIYVKNGMLKRANGTVISVDAFRAGEVDPAYLDDNPNFRVLGKDEPIKVADAILIGPEDNPEHWMSVSEVVPGGEKQANWVKNRLMEVKGSADGKSFAETLNKAKYGSLKLHRVVRFKGFEAAAAPLPTLPPEGPNDLRGLRVAIDVGHGMYAEERGGDYDPGAVANGYQEHNINKLQAFEIEKILEARGATVNIFCYEKGMTNQRLTLGHKGEKAKGHHLMISLHHNALDGRGPLDANYSCTMLAVESDGRKRHKPEDSVFATMIARELGKVMGYGLPSSGGIIRRGLGIFYNRVETWPEVKAACLVESYFMDANALQGKDFNVLSKKAAGAIAKAIADYAKLNKIV